MAFSWRRLALLTSAVCAGAVPACRSNEGEPGRFPLWNPTYDMQSSTIIQPCNMSGWLDDSYAQFGLVSVDWSSAKALWVQPPMSCEEALVEQAARLKAVRPGVRVFGYRNIVKALPWFSSTRARMDDPATASWFLPFEPNVTYHVPACDDNFQPPKCSPLYHDQEQTPGFPHGDGSCPGPCNCGIHPCGEYLYNYLTPGIDALTTHIVDEFILGPTGLGNGNLSGFYLDDEWYNSSFYPSGCSGSPVGGPTEEDVHCLTDMGHAGDIAWTTAMTDAWCAVRHRAFEAARLAGGWFWQMFSLQSTPAQPQCAAALRAMCAAGASSPFYNATTMHSLSGDHVKLPNFAQDLAVFLLLRGPFAWLGFGWSGCGNEVAFPEPLSRDYGTPVGFCEETAPGSGVFARRWTKATVQMDCNAYIGNVTML